MPKGVGGSQRGSRRINEDQRDQGGAMRSITIEHRQQGHYELMLAVVTIRDGQRESMQFKSQRKSTQVNASQRKSKTVNNDLGRV